MATLSQLDDLNTRMDARTDTHAQDAHRAVCGYGTCVPSSTETPLSSLEDPSLLTALLVSVHEHGTDCMPLTLTPTGLGQNLITGSNEAKDNIFYISCHQEKKGEVFSVQSQQAGARCPEIEYRVGLGVGKRKSRRSSTLNTLSL